MIDGEALRLWNDQSRCSALVILSSTPWHTRREGGKGSGKRVREEGRKSGSESESKSREGGRARARARKSKSKRIMERIDRDKC